MEQDTSGVTIRLAEVADVPVIAAVLHAAFVEYEPLYTPGGFAATTPTSERIRERFGEGPVWVAVREGAVVGTVAAVPRGAELYVRSMAVHPTARGLGIGAALFAQVERHAVARGHTRLTLSTTPFLLPAIRLYERLGFQRSAEGPAELFGTPLFTMVKRLEP